MSNDSYRYSYSYGAQAIGSAPEARVDVREFARTLQRFAANVFTTVLEWQERARQRYRLAELDDRMLKDIGLSRAEVNREVGKPFWMQ